MNKAPNLILIGPMGAGKSSIGRWLAERLDLQFFDADRELERRTGAAIPLIFELEGEAGFRRRECALLTELCRQQNAVIATGGGAVLNADIRRLLAESGFVLFLHAAVDQQLRRLQRDRLRPLLATPNRRELLETLARERLPLYAEIADLRFDSSKLPVALTCERLLPMLEARWIRHKRFLPVHAGNHG